MRFEIKDSIPLGLEEAFLLLRDEMPALVPFMPDTEEITVLSREEEGDEVKIVNRWRASLNKIPSALRTFVKPEMLSWNDHASWTPGDHTARWELEALGSSKLFSCRGETSVFEDGDQVYLQIVVDFEIYPERVPGVPRFLAKKLGPQIEKLIGDVLSVNMRQMGQSIIAYAEHKSG